MKLETVGQHCSCRLPEQEGKALVYVDYVEVAPWNLKPLTNALGQKPRYNAIGSRLIEAAVLRSKEEDCKEPESAITLLTHDRKILLYEGVQNDRPSVETQLNKTYPGLSTRLIRQRNS